MADEEIVIYEPGEGENKGLVVQINEALNRELADPKAVSALLATTFKGFDQKLMKQALIEGMMRGFNFKNFVEGDVYPIPFNNRDGAGYSLITSIGLARKIGMRSGVVGKTAPEFTFKNDKIESCSVTIKRVVHGHVGEFTSLVYFDEYNTGRNQWVSKPKTMIAKVAEMHALRMACPEEMSEMYSEEEMEREAMRSSRIDRIKAQGESIKMGALALNHGKENSEEGEAKESGAAEGTQE